MRSAILSLTLLAAVTFGARAADTGEFDDEPWAKEWFKGDAPAACCSAADGHRTTARRAGQGWEVLVDQLWRPVAPNQVIKDPSPFKTPVVWYYYLRGEPVIRCVALNWGL